MDRAYRGPDSRAVRQMFTGIAHRYDFLNRFLSASVDRRWRRAAAGQLIELAAGRRPARCLDLCCGTGDLALELRRRLECEIVASDFCHPMLTRSKAKMEAAGCGDRVRNVEADALLLPFRDGSFDAVTIAFGLRNLEDPIHGLGEMRRVLRPNGALVILEFSRPVIPVFRNAFNFYFQRILPRLGGFISGDRSAYRYLPHSVGRFPSQTELAALMRSCGLERVDYRNLTGGIAALHWGVTPSR